MARAGPRKIRAYSREFELTAVRLSHQPGIQVQAVAALDIRPFMLSKWRKEVRDGVLRGRGRDLRVPQPSEVGRLQELERAHALLQEEHDLLKKVIRFCSIQKPTSSRSSRLSVGPTR